MDKLIDTTNQGRMLREALGRVPTGKDIETVYRINKIACNSVLMARWLKERNRGKNI